LWIHPAVWIRPTLFSSAFSPQKLSLSSRHVRLDRGVEKINAKFEDWIQANGNDAVMWVDANNLRGMGKFEWNPLELHHKVAGFCLENRISNVVMLWDHGRLPSACLQRWKGHSQLESLSSLDMLILFSGLSKRADDVILHESKELVKSIEVSNFWGSMSFITSDQELSYKLRRQSSLDDHESSKYSPLFCDSTRFLELLRRTPAESLHTKDECHQEQILEALLDVKESLSSFYKHQRRGYNPRREKTWERVVLAETFRRGLTHCDPIRTCTSVAESRHDMSQKVFTKSFLTDLQSRGYYLMSDSFEKDVVSEEEKLFPFGPYRGPSRLDKKQKQLLERYNRYLNKQQYASYRVNK
jgi:hypothetical protein